MSCGVGHRRSSDAVLLWLWPRPAATALIRPLAWEPPYAVGAAIIRQKDKKKTKLKDLWLKMWPLYIGTNSVLEIVLRKRKNSFIALPGRGGRSRLAPQKYALT